MTRRSQPFGWSGEEQSSTGNTEYWPKTWVRKDRKARVGGEWEERGRKDREEIKTTNWRLIPLCPKATVGSLDFFQVQNKILIDFKQGRFMI